MKTSSVDTERIERFLHDQMPREEHKQFEGQLLKDEALAAEVQSQQVTYAVVKLHGRKLLRARLQAIHHSLLSDPRKQYFRDKVFSFFGL